MSMAMHNELRALEARVVALEAKLAPKVAPDYEYLAKVLVGAPAKPVLGLKKTA